MELNVHGKQMDVGDALRSHVSSKITDLSSKYFNHTTFANVTFSKEGHGHARTRAHISIQLGKNIMIMADGIEPDPYVAFDTAANKAGKQLRKYKSRLRDHHERLEQTPESEITKATHYVLAVEPERLKEEDDVPHGPDPVVIAEMPKNIQTMSVADAVMRLDLSGAPVMMFRNAKHQGLNVVYRREDGNIGWIDPLQTEKAK